MFESLVWGGISFREGAYVIKCGVVMYERVVRILIVSERRTC